MTATNTHVLVICVSISMTLLTQPLGTHSISFAFNGFDETALKHMTLQGAAAPAGAGRALKIASAPNHVMGRAYYSTKIRIKKSARAPPVSFSTTFIFSIVKYPGDIVGDGMAFFLNPLPTMSSAGLETQWLGSLVNLTDVGVEFDTSLNPEFRDPNDNHVGLDINSLVSKATATAGYYASDGQFRRIQLNSGMNIQAWIDYNYTARVFSVAIAPAGMQKPAKPLIRVPGLDLSGILKETMYVGISATSAVMYQDYYVLGWSFSTDGPAEPLNTSGLPSFAGSLGRGSKRSNHGLLVGVGVSAAAVVTALLAVAMRKKKQYLSALEEEMEEWEKEYWPQRYSHREICTATSFFSERNVLGQGGFGKVYRGRLGDEDVAVKCITREFTEGMRGFLAEISAMGQLKHRNLVRLRGWCRQKQRLFLIYDYMPNHSLDRLIAEKGSVLPWERRFSIVKDVARALVYLHEESERLVVHRDIKSSNVLLDSEMTGRLCDFGLAKLYDHNDNPETTNVVGTLGYIAPELLLTCKSTPASDIFAYGSVVLEVACGRRPVEPFAENLCEIVLADWLWHLYSEGRLLDAADAALGKNYPLDDMELLLKVGLLCVDPKPGCRPTARHALKILEKECSLPEFQLVASLRRRKRQSADSRAHP